MLRLREGPSEEQLLSHIAAEDEPSEGTIATKSHSVVVSPLLESDGVSSEEDEESAAKIVQLTKNWLDTISLFLELIKTVQRREKRMPALMIEYRWLYVFRVVLAN